MRYGLAYHHHARRGGIIALGKLSPPQQPDPHGFEISRAHTRLVHHVAWGQRLTTFHLEIAHGQLIAEGSPIHRACSKYTRQVAEAFQSSRVKGPHLGRRTVRGLRQIHCHGHYVPGFETGVDGPQPQKTLEHQTRTCEQNQRKRNFRNGQRAPQSFMPTR